MNKLQEKEWWTITELHDWLGLGRSKAYELIQSGEIPSHRIGRVIRVRRQDVEEWLQNNRYVQDEG
jgi:excisionase family DNA binding protein